VIDVARDEIHVRLRHSWVALMAFPLSEEQARMRAAGDRSDLVAGDVKLSKPYCERCHLDYVSAPSSCPGEPVSFTPDGDPVFGP
jgi:hypothetical protein